MRFQISIYFMTNIFFKFAGYILATVLLTALGAFAVILPPSLQTVTVSWDYPAEQLGTDLTFKIYHTTDLSVPVTNWTVVANVMGTNLSTKLPLVPGAHFYTVTASNAAGESNFATILP